MKDFVIWLIDNIPEFLMSEPICYFVGLIFGAFVLNIILRIFNFARGSY